MPDLLDALKREAAHTRRDPGLLAGFEALRLNLGTADTAVSTLLDAGLWRRIEGETERAEPSVWGIHLGTSQAQSDVACYWPATGALDAVAAFPAQPSLADRGLREGVGGLYVQCARRGELMEAGGAAVAIPELLAAALARFGRPAAIVADRWREAELRDALDAAGVPRAMLETRGMGYQTEARMSARSAGPAPKAG